MLLEQQYIEGELKSLLVEAKYHLGRVLYEGGMDFNRAISELEDAVRMDPANTRAHYYLGQAIRAQIEREMMRRAQEVLRTYLARGAPLGHEDEVRTFLGARKPLEPSHGIAGSGLGSIGGAS